MLEALNRACDAAGGQSGLGRMCQVSQPTVWYWLNKLQRLPAEYVLTVEAGTGVPREELRPDIYPPASERRKGANA